jgi:hypothetical protein
MDIKYDNERDRFQHGFDAGQIIDGTVVLDENLNRLVIVDEDNNGFDVQSALTHLQGEKVRLTLISFESMDKIEQLIRTVQKES